MLPTILYILGINYYWIKMHLLHPNTGEAVNLKKNQNIFMSNERIQDFIRLLGL
jgi:hypothetical protein